MSSESPETTIQSSDSVKNSTKSSDIARKPDQRERSDGEIDVEAQTYKSDGSRVDNNNNNNNTQEDLDEPEDDPEMSNPETEKDEFLVEFTPGDDRNPKNYTYKRKWMMTIVISMVTFISPVSSSIVAPADTAISKELGITNSYISQMVMTIFVLGYAIGPLVLSPLSELYGRRIVFILTNLFYLAFNLGCGFAQTTAQLVIFRLLAGIGGSAPQSVGSAALSDMWSAEERGKAFSIYSVAPFLGPALGPIAGGFIAENTTWRWAFWSTTIAAGFVSMIIIFLLTETYAPTILKREAARKRKETGDNRYHSKYDDFEKPLTELLSSNLVRPMLFLCTEPIIQFIAVYMAYLYGVFYLLLSTFPRLWTDTYGESVGIGGLNYISVSVGSMLSAQLGSRLLDMFYRKLKAKNNGVGRPEYRVPLMYGSSVLFPAGMFIYGWTGYYHVHWIVPNIGMAIATFGLLLGFTPLQIYVVDSFGRYAASGMASVTIMRSICGFLLPLAGPPLYENLGFGWGNSLLGFIAVGCGIPLPILLATYGRKLRSASKYATKT